MHLLAARHDYALVELHYNNAFLIPIECTAKASLSPEEAYRVGYLERPDRRKKFPWNDNMEDLLHMNPEAALESINAFFEKYQGRYDASI